jgi:nitroimidazol reductase NimA-like FMN-containing flavoprotein (pyridoxamine 5'-phosphate oxidase superfamily)
MALKDVGRVAWAKEDRRVVVYPVNFALDGDDIVFRAAEGPHLDELTAGQPLTFQVDDNEPAVRTGWSVLAHGRPEIVTDEREADRLRSLVQPWSGARPVVIRLRVEELTGRRIRPHAGRVTVWFGPE